MKNIHNYKPGDRVIRTKGSLRIPKGTIGTYESTENESLGRVSWDNGHCGLLSTYDAMEPYQPYEIGKTYQFSDFESFDEESTRTATLLLIMEDNEYKYYIQDRPDNLLGYKYIREVPEPEPEPVQELTLSEIAEKLNIPVDKLRIKD